MFVCYVCDNSFKAVHILLGHMKINHGFNVSNQYICKQGSCVREFQSMYSFRSHLEKKHASPSDNAVVVLPVHGENGPWVLPMEAPVVDAIEYICDQQDLLSNLSNAEFQNIVTRHSIAFLSKLYSVNSITRCQVQNIVGDTNELFSSGFLTVLKDRVISALTEANVSQEVSTEINNLFEICADPFANIDTEYKRLKYLKKTGYYIEPESYIIDEVFDAQRVQGRVLMDSTSLTGQKIPLRIVLKKIFEIKGTLGVTLAHMEELQADKYEFRNLIQGNLWLEKVKLFEGKTVLPILLYFDDYEVNNPIGYHAGVHKMGAVYYTIPCIPQHQLSKLDNIFLALLFHSGDRCVEHGNRKVFQPLVDELIYLETKGISVSAPNGQSQQIYFVLALIVGDNLGLHSILGLTESFSARYSCRFCKIPKALMATETLENVGLLRTVATYENDVMIGDLKQTGIKERCVWNDIPTFHIVDNLVCDIMHDLFEGVCRYVMSKIVCYYNEEKIFSLEMLNQRLEGFDYGQIEINNKPSVITKEKLQNKHLGFSASEMLFFVRYFGFLVGDYVPNDDAVWEIYLTLRQIVDIVTARSILKGSTGLLKTLVSELNEMYVQQFSDGLKPKFHLLLHYPRIIEEVGPLINLWCMRFEAKHKEAKITSHVITTRKNLPLTLAIKQQLKLCYKLLSGKGFSECESVHGPGEMICTDLIDNFSKFKRPFPIDIQSKCILVSWMEINGTRYRPSMVLVTEIKHDTPVFGIINQVVTSESRECFFMSEIMKTVGFHAHVHAYEVVISVAHKSFQCIPFSSLKVTTQPSYILRFYNGNLYVPLRSDI